MGAVDEDDWPVDCCSLGKVWSISSSAFHLPQLGSPTLAPLLRFFTLYLFSKIPGRPTKSTGIGLISSLVHSLPRGNSSSVDSVDVLPVPPHGHDPIHTFSPERLQTPWRVGSTMAEHVNYPPRLSSCRAPRPRHFVSSGLSG